MQDDLSFSTVAELSAALRVRRVSATELARHFLERCERLGPRYNAVVTITRARALREAAQADREIASGDWRGPLHGIPYGAKDLIAAQGYATTWGAEPYREQAFERDATVIARLRDAGAVLVAKLATVELAGGMGYNQPNASFTGPGKSPWNPDHWSGGSSAGPGAAVAAGLVPFALGSETSGSIVTPSAYSGTTGLRPTYGLVSRHGAMALAWTMDKIGPMARSAEDCAAILSVIAGKDPDDPSSVDRGFRWPPVAPAPRRMRIGVLKGAIEGIQPEVAANFTAALRALGRTIEVVEDVELPDFPWGVVTGLVITAEASSAFDDLINSGRIHELTAPEDRTGGYPAIAISARDYLRAMRARRLMNRALDDVLKRFDAIATPTRTTVASHLDRRFGDAWPGVARGTPMIGASNVAGVPAIALPSGFGVEGLPTSLMFTGRAFDEHKLVALGQAYQARTDWHRRRPV